MADTFISMGCWNYIKMKNFKVGDKVKWSEQLGLKGGSGVVIEPPPMSSYLKICLGDVVVIKTENEEVIYLNEKVVELECAT